ncbi:hypothetical protein JKI95_09905 [Corynebacterium aquatimens]|uniref:hypothetical protein n=1 Tax=Corynebacterium TaxID=1716 RepID=UPI001F4118E1|nr:MULTISPECIES: hypothetical protein [Corynebacterium]QYH19401.1 hypothetical protein JKI95_09905 [Corynebacterium aquatimens]UIZ91680.1 hypothetical protein JZY91_08030 [Corynebacterium sp. CNCTC7651]
MRRFTATLAAAAIAATALVAPTAQAQDLGTLGALTQLSKLSTETVATMDCGLLRTSLQATKMVNAETTRSGLVSNLNTVAGNTTFKLIGAPTINAIGDRALACGIVKPDPVTPASKLIEMSSALSSNAGLPELRTIAALSSK